VQAGEGKGHIIMWVWLCKILGKDHEHRIEDLETRSRGVDAELGLLRRWQTEHERKLKEFDAARIARLTDKEAAHVRAGGGRVGHR
jgi:hypothetical protein